MSSQPIVISPNVLPGAVSTRVGSAAGAKTSAPAKSRPWLEFLCGGISGIGMTIVGYPFDTLKVKMQTRAQATGGVIDLAKQVWRQEGLMGFYEGVASPFIGVSFVKAMVFYSFNTCLNLLEKPGEERKTPYKVFLAGIGTGVSLVFIETPIELVKAKMQAKAFPESYLIARAGREPTTISLTAHILREKRFNPRYMFQGMGPTWLRNIPANASYLSVYEYLQKKARETGIAGLPVTIANGGIAGLVYWILTFPADTIKSRMQTDHVDIEKRQARTIVEAAKGIYSGRYSKDPVPTIGIKNFYRGLVPCLMRAFPANAVGFATYEFLKGMITARLDKDE